MSCAHRPRPLARPPRPTNIAPPRPLNVAPLALVLAVAAAAAAVVVVVDARLPGDGESQQRRFVRFALPNLYRYVISLCRVKM